MVNIFKYILIIILLQGNISASANVFARLTFNKKEVMEGEPIKVKLVVYSSTWFTDSPVISDFNIPYSLYLKIGENTSIVKTINGKKYSTIEMNYLFFPQRAGEFKIPPLSIKVMAPVDGDYKPTEQIAITKPITIRVNQAKTSNYNSFIVTPSVEFRQSFNINKHKFKLGDVVERNIYVRAYYTIASMIPEFKTDSLDWAKVYYEQTKLKTIQTDNSLKAISEQTIKYLLVKAGEYTIPSIDLYYYDVVRKKYKHKELPKYKITILPNDNLNIANSLRDTLDDTNNKAIRKKNTKKKYLYILSVLGILICLISILFKKVKRKIKEFYTLRKNREIYAFINIYKEKNYSKKYSNIHLWYYTYYNTGITLDNYIKNSRNSILYNQYVELQKEIIGEKSIFNNKIFTKELRKLKKELKQNKYFKNNTLKPLYP